ncbi:MAG: TIGR04100 family radical SAM protein [Lachnospiraceae bacterium]|nr:TIGR04100 family radical SAM protein [Lachnospiraceae bacterium]
MSEIKKAQTILYEVHNNLYVNLTNRCPCNCTFCLRQTRDHMEESESLWLEHEPSIEELKEEFKKFDMSGYGEVVFCGFGEPTERLQVLLEAAAFVKQEYGKNVRVNTNGLSDLINKTSTAPMFQEIVDTVSISLNTPKAEQYLELTRSRFGIQSFEAVLTFAKDVKQYVDTVVLTTVDTTLSGEEEEECRTICENLGVTYRIRPWED